MRKHMRLDKPENQESVLLVHHFPAEVSALRNLREKIKETLHSENFPPDMTEDIIIAVDEACQNIIRHAYGQETHEKIILSIHQQTNAIVITLRDYAPTIDMDSLNPRDLEEIRPGGLGCHFMQQTMDEIELRRPRSGKGNVLRMRKQFS